MNSQAVSSYSQDAECISWTHPRVLLILVLVFAVGVGVGGTISHAVMHRGLVRPANSAMRLMVLKRELNLSPQQEQLVKKELDDYAKYYQNIDEERADVAEHGKQRILEVLTPEQRKQFNTLFDRFGK